MKKVNNYLVVGIALFIMCGVSIFAYDQYKKRTDTEDRLIELTAAYNRLAEDSKVALDNAEITHIANIKKLSTEKDSIETLYRLERRRSKALQDKLDAITLNPTEVDPDISYIYINETYPAKAEKKYDLDDFQIKMFHQVDLVNKANQLLTESLYESLEHCDNMSFNLSQQLNEYKGLYDIMSKKYDIALSNNKRLLIELGDMTADFQRKLRKNKLTIAGILTGVAAGTVAIIVLN